MIAKKNARAKKKRKSTMPQKGKKKRKTDQTYQKVALLISVRLASASRVLLCRFEGKAAMPDKLQLKCQFEHQMNLIACFKSLKQRRHNLYNFRIIERLELQKSTKYRQIALHCACTLRRAWLTLVKILEIRGDEGLGRWMVWCQAMGQFGQSAPAPPLKYQPHPGRRQHLRPCWITNPCTPGRNFKKKHKTKSVPEEISWFGT